MEVLAFLTSRPFIFAVAVLGAAIAMLGSYLMREGSAFPPGRAKLVMRSGYGVTWVSVAAFIVAGFIAE